jgi:hypothetical protein
MINSRITVGAWFVAGGFYAFDPTYAGQVAKTLTAVWWGTHQMSGYLVEVVALVVAAAFVVRALARKADAARLIPVALFAPAALPFYAFVSGHPFRIRYMIPVVAACALFAGLSVGLLKIRRTQVVAATVLACSLALESPLWDGSAPLIVEAQWDVPVSLNRRAVTECLGREYQGDKVLASMASLAHYMQELSHQGFDIADFIHEGNGVIWNTALDSGAAPHAGWMLVEEEAEGGDVIAQRIRRHPEFARGMTRVCEGGGVALYKRSSIPALRSTERP